MADIYDVGDEVQLIGKFYDVNDALIDPTTIHVTYRTPGGTTVTKTYPTDITRDSLGIYSFIVNVNEGGTWRYRWHSSGNAQAAGEKTFVARTPGVTATASTQTIGVPVIGGAAHGDSP